ncbi:hypothetical protein [Azospirillum doebereinerae]|uniref:Uncharacterized protein n=1 Tax=Azospirillum doebereinerae TaxID=92933 RepID=A0A433IZI2_9PROT|nr:hypothetical protein [Azospirillum doebereinerae]MCG5241683.1 hypothetical protein [Azospirillum doebereinerae]RUQ60417.1 hypothetical protein EJ913_30590 [Azospirillum doebereinerae]
MSRTMILLACAALAAVQPVAAQAASSVCRTVNGRSVCTQSGDATTCQTVNGRTQCLSGPGTLRCETVDGRTACSSTPGRAVGGGAALPPEDDPSDAWDEVMPGVPSGPPTGSMPPAFRPQAGAVSVERDAQGLRVRAGTLDLRLGKLP